MSLYVDIRKRFPDFELDVKTEIGDETLGFLGASGCGKSLTMRCIAGIETPDEGKIVVNDKVFFDSKEKIDLTPQERKTALLFQNYMLFPNLTVEQNVAAGIDKGTSKEEVKRIVSEELVRFGLEGHEKRYPSQLSGGQQQRVALARMLAAKPSILMLDEPFSALDAHLKGILEQNLVDLFDKFDGTILYVSHDIDEALRFCDKIAVVEGGRILEIDSGDELTENPKSAAAIKLSGCKNCVEVNRVSEHEIEVPNWGIQLTYERIVPEETRYLGVRAFSIKEVDGPGENCFEVVVDRVSDSRFDRTALLSFKNSSIPIDDADEMKVLNSLLYWRINKGIGHHKKLPERGDRIWVHIPTKKTYLVDR